jgi:IS30 family transposase
MVQKHKNSKWKVIKELLEQNWTVRQIARELDLSVQCIYGYIRRNDYDYKPIIK